MSDTKISALTAIAGANVDRAADLFALVDTSVTTTKKITVAEALNALHTLATAQASTSGTSIDFTAIPAGVKRITVMFVGVSTNGTSNPLIQIGDAGGVEATGYLGSSLNVADSGSGSHAVASYTTGFGLNSAAAATVLHGAIRLTLENSSAFTWVASGSLSMSNNPNVLVTSGSKSLSAELDRVRITTVGGSDTFDAGAINISYE